MALFGRKARPKLWPTGTYTDWRWPASAEGYERFAWTVTPENDPTPIGYFWSHQFAFVGGPAAYCGLQTLGSEPTGKIAIFSVWEARSGDSPEHSAPFDGEGSGWTVRIRFRWTPGSTYALAVERAGPARWRATVEGQPIGEIDVPARWGGLADRSVMWTERYSGPALRSCADVGFASAVFGEPVADDGVRPERRHSHLWNPPGCSSDIEDVEGGVRQRMGLTERAADG